MIVERELIRVFAKGLGRRARSAFHTLAGTSPRGVSLAGQGVNGVHHPRLSLSVMALAALVVMLLKGPDKERAGVVREFLAALGVVPAL
jgi:hypothetical protein